MNDSTDRPAQPDQRPMPAAAAHRRPKPKRRLPPEVLSDTEVRRLLDACHPCTTVGKRNRALIVTLYRAGLRIAEALDLRPKDIDFESGSLRILCGKGGRPRTVGIDPAGLTLLAAWLKLRMAMPVPLFAPLFCTKGGGTIATAYIRREMTQLGRKASIAKRVHAHGLRHTHAAQLRSEGIDIGIISKQLGHRSITTTARYLDHIQPMAVLDAMRGRKWD